MENHTNLKFKGALLAEWFLWCWCDPLCFWMCIVTFLFLWKGREICFFLILPFSQCLVHLRDCCDHDLINKTILIYFINAVAHCVCNSVKPGLVYHKYYFIMILDGDLRVLCFTDHFCRYLIGHTITKLVFQMFCNEIQHGFLKVGLYEVESSLQWMDMLK